ncbi:MAG: DNA-3-methyladenine glycosylase 2 family protein [Acidimicrobiia bacterium]|nr:DNA-3-methyladenine glycosylase 2 family protein [Acidimicrobiia bacterium]
MSATRRLSIPDPFDLGAAFSALLGPGGNTARVDAGTSYLASFTPSGPVQLSVKRDGAEVVATAWGPGADSELDSLPTRLGLDDDPDEFVPPPGPVREMARRMRGLRLGSTERVWEAVAPTILAQRITTGEAKSGYRRLVRTYGEPAPGPPGLLLPPAPEAIAGLSYEDFHRHGIERSRADILREAARRAKRLEEIVAMDRESGYARLHAVRGIGPWTSGHVMGIAWGDNDAVPVGDFHLPNTVAWALAGEDRADDARMLELLEPYRPHRRRVIAMLKRSGAGAPKYGPKSSVVDIRKI